MIESMLVGVLSSLVASALFLVVLFRLRPKIEISPEIADQSTDEGPCFAFKFINRSRYQAFDISVEVLFVTPSQAPGGPVNNMRDVVLTRSRFHMLGEFSPKDEQANYAFRVRTFEDLKKSWSSTAQSLRVSVVSRHALSGFSGIKTMVFNTKGQIRKGRHRFGNHLNVEPIE
jgi:hypothetical protein